MGRDGEEIGGVRGGGWGVVGGWTHAAETLHLILHTPPHTQWKRYHRKLSPRSEQTLLLQVLLASHILRKSQEQLNVN